jgi:polyhydroxyalkanoate synthase subunit PhaC
MRTGTTAGGVAGPWLVVLAVTLLTVGIADLLLLTRGSLAPRLLRPGRLRRWTRAWRAATLRVGAGLFGWTHALLRLVGGDTSVPVATTPGRPVAARGDATLLQYEDAPAADRPPGEAVLVVHAVVTRPWILDLTPEHSLVAHLRRRGHRVFLLDWGDPTDTDAGLDRAVETLAAAEAEVRRRTGATRVHLVAYCSGSTVTLARLGALDDDRVASCTLLAPPVAAIGGMHVLAGDPALRPAWLLDGRGMVPASVVRESFHLLRPAALRAVLARARVRRDPARARRADALTRWTWEQRDLPGRMLFDLVDLARRDALHAGTLRVLGLEVHLRDIAVPVRVVVGARDHLVPPASSLALADHLDVDVVEVDCGHVAMLAGSHAPAVVHPAVAGWVEAHAGTRPDGAPAVPGRSVRSAR